MIGFSFSDYIKLFYYLLDHIFHLHSNLEADGNHCDQADSSTGLITEPETNSSEPSTKSSYSVGINEFSSIKNGSGIFSSILKQTSRLINYHRNVQARCLLRIASFFVCLYLLQDMVSSLFVLSWIKKGHISLDCLKGEVCTQSEREKLLSCRIFDLLVAVTYIMPEIHVLSFLISLSCCFVTGYCSFIRDVHGQCRNPAALYIQLLKYYKIHRAGKSYIFDGHPVSDDKVEGLNFNFNDFRINTHCVRKTRWRIREQTLVFLETFTKYFLINSSSFSVAIWIGYLALNSYFYWLIFTPGVTLEEEQLREDFRPYVGMRSLVSVCSIGLKIVYENFYFAHFVHHTICCIILKERFHTVEIQANKISEYLINYKYFMKQLDNKKDDSLNELWSNEENITGTRRFSNRFKTTLPYYHVEKKHSNRFVCWGRKDRKLLSMQLQELQRNKFQTLISTALDENFRCIGAIRTEFENLRHHFKPFLTVELLTKVPISVFYIARIALSSTNINEHASFFAKVQTIVIGIALMIILLPLIILTGVVQKSIKQLCYSLQTIMLNHNDFIDFCRMDRLVRVSQDLIDETPVVFVTFGGVPTSPKAMPKVCATIASGVLLTLQFQS